MQSELHLPASRSQGFGLRMGELGKRFENSLQPKESSSPSTPRLSPQRLHTQFKAVKQEEQQGFQNDQVGGENSQPQSPLKTVTSLRA